MILSESDSPEQKLSSVQAFFIVGEGMNQELFKNSTINLSFKKK